MISFTPLRTKRLGVQLRELSIKDAIAVSRMPIHLHEAGTAFLLGRTVEAEQKPRVAQVTDQRLWTVQERAFVVAHYLAHTNEGTPDFAIGDGKFSDYFLSGADASKEKVCIGEVAGDRWNLFPLLGAHAESIERLVTGDRLPAERAGWWMGAMGAMLCRDKESPIDVEEISDAELDDHIAKRADIFGAYHESDFAKLLQLFLGGVEQLDHLFRLDFGDDGVRFLPTKQQSEGGPALLPVRFPFRLAVSQFTADVFGSPI